MIHYTIGNEYYLEMSLPVTCENDDAMQNG